MLKFGCNQNFCHNSIFLSLNTTRIKINYVPKWEKIAQIFNAYLFQYMYITTYLTNPVVCYRIWRNWIILSIETCFLQLHQQLSCYIFSSPWLQADYALRYKTGVSVPRPRRHKFSEYQKSFSWKDGAKASPVLAAEQVSQNSHNFAWWGHVF